MHITDTTNLTPAAQRAQARLDERGSASRDQLAAQQARAAAPAGGLNVLDTDQDGWIDEDDLPYDQLVLLARQRAARSAAKEAAATVVAVPAAPLVPRVAPAPAAPLPQADAPAPDEDKATPHIDLLA